MRKNQTWQATAVLEVGYRVGNEGQQSIARQFFDCKVPLSHEHGLHLTDAIIDECKRAVVSKMLKRLANSLDNYGVVGLKRWIVDVVTIRVNPVLNEEEDE